MVQYSRSQPVAFKFYLFSVSLISKPLSYSLFVVCFDDVDTSITIHSWCKKNKEKRPNEHIESIVNSSMKYNLKSAVTVLILSTAQAFPYPKQPWSIEWRQLSSFTQPHLTIILPAYNEEKR